MEEIWKDLAEANGKNKRYQISNYGRIRSISIRVGRGQSERILKQYHYHRECKHINEMRTGVRLNGISKEIRIHQAVAMYFVPNPHKYKYVRHIDGNMHNNRADNLVWTRTSHGQNKVRNDVLRDAVRGPLPIFDREVIVLTMEYNPPVFKVAFAHRPEDDKVKKYGKGGRNIPNVIWWIDCDIPEIEQMRQTI